MDDTTSATGLPLWRPQSRLGGSVEIVLNFYHPLTGRETFGSLSPTEYLEAWTERRLSFQIDGTPKPDHLPTPEQVEEFLRHKGTSLSAEVAVSLRQRKLQAELRNAVANTISGTQAVAAPVPTDSSVVTGSEDEVLEIDSPVPTEASVPALFFERRRRTSAEKYAVLELAVSQLRKEKQHDLVAQGVLSARPEDAQLEVSELVMRAAQLLHMSQSGLKTYLYRSVAKETIVRWLQGKHGRTLTRKELKFEILLRVREALREKGGLAPRKKELAEAAAPALEMTLASTCTYIYDRLTGEEVAQLDLRIPPRTKVEQLAVLVHVRTWMKEQKQPAPRISDLARIAAPYLGHTMASVRTLITNMSEEEQEKLELQKGPVSAFCGLDEVTTRDGFLGALAVLRMKQILPTIKNLQDVLKISRPDIELYLSLHPDIEHLIEHDEPT